MPSVFTHSFVALALGKTAATEKMPARFYLLAALCSILPDFDVVGFRFGIRYGDMLGHRGFSHSLFFAAILGILVVMAAFPDVRRLSKQWWLLAAFFFGVTASHGLLDAMTTGGYGIGFFVPLDNTRYFLPWRPLAVSPISVHPFFSPWGAKVLKSEFLWVWVPGLLAYLFVRIVRRRSGAFMAPKDTPSCAE